MDRCLYMHLTPGEGRVFYVGIGSLKRAREFNTSRNKYWKKTVEKCGKPSVLILAANLSIDDAVKWEKFWIRHIGLDRLTNISPGGDSILGFTVSEETRIKIGNSLRGRKLSKEHIENAAKALRGKKRPPEVVAKIAAINTGKKRSAQSKENMRNSHLGTRLTEEHKKRIGDALKGIKKNKEHVLKRSELRKHKELFTFQHALHGIVTCTKNDLIVKYNLDGSAIYGVVNKRRNSHKGWSLFVP